MNIVETLDTDILPLTLEVPTLTIEIISLSSGSLASEEVIVGSEVSDDLLPKPPDSGGIEDTTPNAKLTNGGSKKAGNSGSNRSKSKGSSNRKGK